MQSLVMLNDPHFVHAARSLAARVLREAEPSTDARLTYLYQLVVSRQPTTEERSQLHQLLDAQHAAYQDDPDAASTLIASNDRGDVWNLDEIDHAVWTILASTLMSLDESMTKG